MSRHGIIEKDASAGYSLVEMLFVVALATALLAAAVLGIARLQQEWELWGAARVPGIFDAVG